MYNQSASKSLELCATSLPDRLHNVLNVFTKNVAAITVSGVHSQSVLLFQSVCDAASIQKFEKIKHVQNIVAL